MKNPGGNKWIFWWLNTPYYIGNVSLFPSNGGRNDIVHHPREPMMDWGVAEVIIGSRNIYCGNVVMCERNCLRLKNPCFIQECPIYSRWNVSVDFSQRCSIFSSKQIKCRYLDKINGKSRTGINWYFYFKNPLLWEWHFHKLLCDEMIFPAPSGNIISSHKSLFLMFNVFNVSILVFIP